MRLLLSHPPLSERNRRLWQIVAKPVPDSVRHLLLHDIYYYIEWEQMLPGHSFYLKTAALVDDVRAQLPAIEKHFKITLKAHQRCEFGHFGVRVWRIA